MCRATPHLHVIRPADGNEVRATKSPTHAALTCSALACASLACSLAWSQVSGAYAAAIENKKEPTVLALTRQNCPQLAGTSIEGVAKGGYVISEPEGKVG